MNLITISIFIYIPDKKKEIMLSESLFYDFDRCAEKRTVIDLYKGHKIVFTVEFVCEKPKSIINL